MHDEEKGERVEAGALVRQDGQAKAARSLSAMSHVIDMRQRQRKGSKTACVCLSGLRRVDVYRV